MLKVGQLYGELELDRKPFDRGLDSAEGKAKGWAGRVGGILSGGAKFLLKWGTIAGGAAAGGAFALANMAGDLNESLSKVNVVFGDLSGSVTDWSKNAAAGLGMSQQKALEAAGTYGNLFQAMGVGQKAATDMSTGLVDLSADLASFNNMDPTQVLDALRSGLSGETEPLKRLGVNLNVAAIEAKALESGLWDGVGTISNAAKAQATYALVLEQTSMAHGDFERTSGGMANQQRIVAATFQDTLASIGQAFVPIFEAILPQVTAALQSFAGWVQENAPTIQAVIEGVMAGIGVAIGFLSDVVFPVLAEVIGFIVKTVIPAFASAFDGVSNGTIPIISDAISILTENVLPALRAIFEAVVGWIVANWPKISSVVGQVAGAVGTAFGVIAGIIKAVWPIIEAVARVLFPLIGAAASVLLGVLDGTFKLIGGVFEVAGNVASTVADAIGDAWRGLSRVLSRVWDTISSVIRGGINTVISLVNRLIGFLNNIRVGIPELNIPGTDIRIGGGHFDPFNLPLLPRLAQGTRGFPGGWALVGERGPELLKVPAGADVFSNRDSGRMLSGIMGREGPLVGTVYGYLPGDLEREIDRAVRRVALEWELSGR